MKTKRLVLLSGLVSILAHSGALQAQPAALCECAPVSGQPAADVLASHDVWGNPTFVGGITNGGPDAGSVW